ncbi:MAG TPA: sigma-54 dependent transcriptional regulator [Pyrinomonadaceae bacterium]|jgi:DNA-binding NtrC family response regulator|nr:sigma-54 dependent transcriptional regulator [Pyrinomonadaceae bacterium]
MKGDGARILIVDDEAVVRESLGDWFRDEGYEIDTADSAKAALEKVVHANWDIFLLDIRMPGIDGLELQRKLKEAQPDATIIIMTAYASVESAVEAMKQGAYDYIIKPFNPDDLEHTIQKAMEHKQLVSENIQLRTKIDELNLAHEIVGMSAATRRLLEQVAMVSASDTTVLIGGESGTGKELIARAIHANSDRRYMPVVVVNCGALSEGVLESELFGHEKGAFTGAQYRRKGKFEMADGGTLFLDEIGDIGLKTQVDLLRVLEEKKIFRVGGNLEIPVNFRLIAATNKNLETMNAEGKFREDLYYRINVFAITIPPLRERREDITLLANHFLTKFAHSMNRPIMKISAEAENILMNYDWPGNVRELQNAIERAVLICKSGKIERDDLPVNINEGSSKQESRSLAEIERQHIKRTLEETGWNIYRAARLLEIDRVTLYNRIKKYGFKREPTTRGRTAVNAN